MKIGFMTNAWGTVLAYANATTNVNDAHYFSTGPNSDAIKAIGAAGFEYIEMLDGNLLQYENNEETFRALLKENNVELLTVYCAGNFIYDEILDEELYKITRAVKFAKKFGAKFLIVGGGARRYDGVRESDYEKLGKALDKVVDIARKEGMASGYHPHTGALVLEPHEIDKFMESTSMDLYPDLGHICAGGGDPVEIVRKYASRIHYVHLKDYNKNGFCLFGEGDINFKEIVNILSKNEAPVTYTVEADDYDGDPDVMVKIAAKNARELFGL